MMHKNLSKLFMTISCLVLLVCAMCGYSPQTKSALAESLSSEDLYKQAISRPNDRQKKRTVQSDDNMRVRRPDTKSKVDSKAEPESRPKVESKPAPKPRPESKIEPRERRSADGRDWDGGRSWMSKFGPFSEGGGYDFDRGLLSQDNKLRTRVIWSRELPAKLSNYLTGNPSPLYHKGFIYILGSAEQIMKIDALTGRIIWIREFIKKKDDESAFATNKSFSTPLAMNDNAVFTSTSDGMIYKLDANTGEILWKVYAGHPVRMIKVWQQNLILMTADNLVLVFSENDGSLLWQDQGASTAFFGSSSIYTSLDYSEPVIMGDNLVAAFSNGSVVSWKMFNGQKMWNHTFSSNVLSNTGQDRILTNTDIFDVDASLVRDGQNIYVLSSMEGLYALNYLSGNKIWHIADVQGFVTPWINGNNLFVVSDTDDVMSVDVSTGKILWERNLRDQILWAVGLGRYSSQSSRKMFKTSDSERLTRQNESRQKGSRARADRGGERKVPSSVVDSSEVSSIRSSLLKRRPYWFSPVMINSKLMLVSNTGLLMVLSSKDGEILSLQKLDMEVVGQPIVSNGRMFVVSSGGALIALE